MTVKTLSNGPRECHHLDPTRSALAQGGRGRGDRGAARVNVVDEDDGRRHGFDGLECATDVSAPLGESQAFLWNTTGLPSEQRNHRKLPVAA
jgi:hypothetical protein